METQNKYQHQLKPAFIYPLSKKFPLLPEDLREDFIDASPACDFDECLAYSCYTQDDFSDAQFKDVKRMWVVCRLHAIQVAVQALSEIDPARYLDWVYSLVRIEAIRDEREHPPVE